MTTLVIMPLDDEYFKIGDEIYELFQDPKAPSQKNNVDRAAQLLISGMLDLMIVKMIENVKMKPFARKIVMQLEGVIQKTANALVHKVILKLSNKELWPLVNYLRSIEVEIEGKRYLSFSIDDFAEKALKQAHIDIDSNNLKAARDNFQKGMENVLDQGLYIFYKEPMSMLKLGFVMRKIVDVGYVAIHAAVHPAINKIVHGMEIDELQSLKHYVDSMTVEVE